MKVVFTSFLLFISSLFMSEDSLGQNTVPHASKKNKTLTAHGQVRIDPYYWMNERNNDSVLSYIEKENAYAKNYFSRIESLQTKLLSEFETRIDPNETSSPFLLNKHMYQIRQQEGLDYDFLYELDGKEATVYFDENERAKKSSFYQMGDWVPSPNNKLLAVSEDTVGRRNYTIHFRVNRSKIYMEDKIDNTDGSIVWANDNKTVFYIRRHPTTLREYQVWRHKLGSDPKMDVLVYEEVDEKYSVYIGKAMTGSYIQIGSYSSLTSELWLIDANKPTSKPVVFLARETNHIYSLDYHENGFYITSNKNAENRQIYFSSRIPKKLSECTLIQVVDENVLIENTLVFSNHIVVEERVNGLQRIKLIDIKTKKTDFISFDEETYTLGFAFNDDYEGGNFFFAYKSMTVPPSVFSYNLKTGERNLIHQKKLIDPNFKSDNYRSKRVWATAEDGTKIPVSIVYHKNTVLKDAPILIYGYGSYGYTIPDGFSATRISLLDRGFVFAIAHIRGGKYLGEKWYQDGKFLNKKNTFTDFIAVANYLKDNQLCHPDKIYAMGGSAGGLLMGAITNMAPGLWKGIISQVPFVDVVTTMLDETIPLTVGEYEEWGNPNEKAYYDYMLSYSPYDNLVATDYPAIFITTGYHDSQVQYWEPLKYVAKIRDLKTDDSPMLLECNMDAGHGGGSGRTAERKEIARVFTFILDLEGIAQ
jgi:oligopeptidase B